MNPNTVAARASRPSLGARLVRGTLSSLFIGIATNGFLFVGQLLIPRALSREDYAHFTISISFVAIFALLADLGMNPYFTRAFARAEEEVAMGSADTRGQLLGSALLLRVLMAVLTAVLVLVFGSMLYSSSMVSGMSILLLSLIISSRLMVVRSVGESVLRSEGRYYLVATFALIDAVTFAVVLIMRLHGGISLTAVLWIYTLCNVPGFLLVCWSVASWVRQQHLRISVDVPLIVDLLKSAFPLILATAFMTIHTQIDSLLLDRLSTSYEVASYGATVRLFAAMGPIAVILAAVTAPELTKLLHRRDFARSKQITDLSLRVLLVLGVAIALFLSAASQDVVRLLLGDKYISAGPLLAWTGWMLLPIFTATFLMEANIAAGEFWFTTTYAAVIMVVVIVCDLLFIPTMGASGAMLAKLSALVLGCVVLVWSTRNSPYMDIDKFLASAGRIALSGLMAYATLRLARSAVASDLLTGILALAVYFTAIHFTKVASLQEAMSIAKRIRPNQSTEDVRP